MLRLNVQFTTEEIAKVYAAANTPLIALNAGFDRKASAP